MIAYHDDFALMLGVILACLPLLLLIRGPRLEPIPAEQTTSSSQLLAARLS